MDAKLLHLHGFDPNLWHLLLKFYHYNEFIKLCAEWDAWGIPDDYECEVIENDAPIPKHIPVHRPGPLPEEFYNTLQAVQSGTLADAIAKSKDKNEPENELSEAEPK